MLKCGPIELLCLYLHFQGRLKDLEETNVETQTKLADSNKMLATMTDSLQESQQRSKNFHLVFFKAYVKVVELMEFRNNLESQLQNKVVENQSISTELEDMRKTMRVRDLLNCYSMIEYYFRRRKKNISPK